MKKSLIVCGVASFCIFIFGISFAETIGSPGDIHLPKGKGVYSVQMGDFISLNAGFDTEFLAKKKFEHDPDVTSKPELEGVYYMGKFGCTLFDRIQPYFKVGVSELEVRWNDANGAVKMETSVAPSWGAGLKAYLWEFEGLGLKVLSTVSFRTTKADRIRTLSVGGTTGNLTNKKFEITERQVSLGLSKEISIPGFENTLIVPYAGGVWSETNARVSATQGTNIINSGIRGQDNNLGLFFGADFIFMDNLSLNVEGRFIDQQAASVGFTALF